MDPSLEARVPSSAPSPRDVEHAFVAAYPKLHELARRLLRHERADHTLQATALVHEVWLRLAGDAERAEMSETELLARAVTAMRRVLVNHAVARRAAKRGGGGAREPLDRAALDLAVDSVEREGIDLPSLDEALARLAELDPLQARVVELRFFAGASETEIASALELSDRTVRREWTAARAWLRARIAGEREDARGA